MATAPTATKPGKPYPDFPLFPHATKRWAKKIRGKMHYFGPWSDWQGALKKYEQQAEEYRTGRELERERDALTVRGLVTRFLDSQRVKLAAGQLAPVTFTDCRRTCKLILDTFGDRPIEGLSPRDFEQMLGDMARRGWGPVTIGNNVQRVRTVFSYAVGARLLDVPVSFGGGFRRPEKKVLRLARAAKGPRMIEATELRTVLQAAGARMRAMILLGINCGYGNHDVATLPIGALDLDAGWTHYPRPKTGIDRRCPLWPETVAALRGVLAHRGTPQRQEHAGLVLLTRRGQPWSKELAMREKLDASADASPGNADPISRGFTVLLKRLGLHRPGLGFYALRHTFETIAGGSKDQVAVDHIMGHDRGDMATLYRERIDDDRLRAVVEYVHRWLFNDS